MSTKFVTLNAIQEKTVPNEIGGQAPVHKVQVNVDHVVVILPSVMLGCKIIGLVNGLQLLVKQDAAFDNIFGA